MTYRRRALAPADRRVPRRPHVLVNSWHGGERASAGLGPAAVARAAQPRAVLGGDRRGRDRLAGVPARVPNRWWGGAGNEPRLRGVRVRAVLRLAALNPYDDPDAADAVAGLKERGAVGIVVEPGIADEPAYVDDPRDRPAVRGVPRRGPAAADHGRRRSGARPLVLRPGAARPPRDPPSAAADRERARRLAVRAGGARRRLPP